MIKKRETFATFKDHKIERKRRVNKGLLPRVIGGVFKQGERMCLHSAESSSIPGVIIGEPTNPLQSKKKIPRSRFKATFTTGKF